MLCYLNHDSFITLQSKWTKLLTYFGLKKNQLTKWKKNIIAQTFLPLSDLIRK